MHEKPADPSPLSVTPDRLALRVKQCGWLLGEFQTIRPEREATAVGGQPIAPASGGRGVAALRDKILRQVKEIPALLRAHGGRAQPLADASLTAHSPERLLP